MQLSLDGLAPPADGQPVIIEELTLGGAVLVLDGKDRPDPSVQVPTTQRSTQDWYPGRREALVQLMGVEEGQVTLTGLWHDDLKRLTTREGPLEILQQARGILARMRPCRLVWGSAIRRNGRLVAVTPTFIRDRVIEYELVFEVDRALENYDQVPHNARAANLREVRSRADRVFRTVSDAMAVATFGRGIVSKKRRFKADPPQLRAASTLIHPWSG